MKEETDLTGKIKGLYPHLASTAPVLLLYLIFGVSGRLYDDYDNYNVAIVINGLLSDNNYCQYQHPLLCLILKGVKAVLPAADSFTLLVHILLIVAMSRIIYVLFGRYAHPVARLLIAAFMLYLSWGLVIWNANYTVQAAFLCAAGIIELFACSLSDDGMKGAFAGAFFFDAGLMIRHQAALMFIPYILLAAGAYILAGSGKLGERQGYGERASAIVKRLLPWLISAIILLTGFKLFYSFEPYKSGLEFDRARVKVWDFPVSEWNELKDKPEDLDKTIYRGAIHGLYADTNLVNIYNLKKIADAGSKWRYPVSPAGIVKGIREIAGMLIIDKTGLAMPVILLVLSALGIFMITDSRYYRLEAVLAVIGTFTIIIYFIMKGRAPSRVWLPPVFASLGIMAVVPLRLEEGEKIFTKGAAESRKRALLCLGTTLALFFIAVSTYLLCTGSVLHRLTTPLNACGPVKEDKFSGAYGGNRRYLLCGWDISAEDDNTVSESYLHGWYEAEKTFIEQGKLPPAVFFRYYLSSGEFFYGQEYHNDLLHEIGIDNPIEALFERDDLYLLDMSRDTLFREFFYVYLYEHYGEMTVREVGNINGSPVFEFRR